jgi:hypothetical protein
LSGVAQAQVLLPETGLNIDVGAAIRERPTHLGANAYTLEALPVIQGQWGKDLQFSVDDGIQYKALRFDRLTLGPDLEYRQPYNDHLPPRTKRTSDALEGGAFAKVDLTYAELDMRVRKAVNGYQGYSGDIALDTLVPLGGKWFVALEARVGWADRRFALDAFGRTSLPGQVAVSTPIGDYYSAGGQVILIYTLTKRNKLVVGLSDDQILRPSRGVTGADTRNAPALFVAFTRRFGWPNW